MILNTSLPAITIIIFTIISSLFIKNLKKTEILVLTSTTLCFLNFLYTFYVYYKNDTIFNLDLILCYHNNKILNLLLDNFTRDGISLIRFGLTNFILLLCFIFEFQDRYFSRFWIISILFIYLLLIRAFTTNNFLIFYITFEFILIPTFIVIAFFGSRGRRLHASLLFFFYTFVSSMFLLFSFILIALFENDLRIFFTSSELQYIWTLFAFLGFAAKIPTFPVHLWLPEAHVEAPTVGSVILASLLLKLGGYGLLRIVLRCPTFVLYKLQFIVFPICLRAIVLGSLSAIRHTDFKRVIAYSSIVHRNISIISLFTGNVGGAIRCLYSRISHAFIASGLFFCAGRFYARLHSRNLAYYGGSFTTRKNRSFLFLFFRLANIGFPPLSGFIAELLIFLNVFYLNLSLLLFSIISFITVALFGRALVIRALFGLVFDYSFLNNFTKREILILIMLVILIVLSGIFPNILLNNIVLLSYSTL